MRCRYEADNSFLDLVSGNGFRYAFLVISIALLVFSFLVLLNFLLFTIDTRKREMDVPRSLGASRGELFSICLSESLMFSLLSGVLSFSILFLVYELYNHKNGFYLFLFRYPLALVFNLASHYFLLALNAVTAFSMLGVSLLVFLLSLIHPAKRLSRQRIITMEDEE